MRAWVRGALAFGSGVSFGFLDGMLSFFPPECAKYSRSGYLGEHLRSMVRRLSCRRFAKAQVVHCGCRVNEGRRPFNLPRTGIFCAFAPVFRRDGLRSCILPRAIRCTRQGRSAMEGACPRKRPFAFGVLVRWQKAGWFVSKGTGARSCQGAPQVDGMRRLSRKARSEARGGLRRAAERAGE